MSNIVKYEGRVQDTDLVDVQNTVYELYRLVYGITGYRLDEDKIKQIKLVDVPLTTQYIKETHPRRTAEDLEKAFKWGALGKFGEFTGINTKTIAGWLNGYIQTYEFKDSLKPEPKKELPPPPMNYQEIYNEGLQQYKKGVQMQGLASLYFNACHKLGKFDWKDEIFVEECKYRARVKMAQRMQELEDRKLRFKLSADIKNEKSEAFKAECRRQAVLIKWDEDEETT